MNPAAQASCLPDDVTGLEVGAVPDELVVTTSDGARVRLNRRQLTHAATIMRIGGRTDGVGRDGVTVALMAALTESGLRMLSNASASPGFGGAPPRRRRRRPRQSRPVSDEAEHRLGQRRGADGSRLPGPGVLRWRLGAQPRFAARTAGHPRLAITPEGHRRPSGGGLGPSRSIRTAGNQQRQRSSTPSRDRPPEDRRCRRPAESPSRSRPAPGSRRAGSACASTRSPESASCTPGSTSPPPAGHASWPRRMDASRSLDLPPATGT